MFHYSYTHRLGHISRIHISYIKRTVPNNHEYGYFKGNISGDKTN